MPNNLRFVILPIGMIAMIVWAFGEAAFGGSDLLRNIGFVIIGLLALGAIYVVDKNSN
jgi:hypothetical protein